MLTTLGTWGRRLAAHSPWSNVYGLARSLLAAGTMLTLAANPAAALFRPTSDMPAGPHCVDLSQASLFCLARGADTEFVKWLAFGLLALVASGWRPKVTGVLHWWVSFSFFTTATLVDGGDQVTAVLTLLLVPVTLLDQRRWHWSAPAAPEQLSSREEITRVVAHLVLVAVRLQVAVVYFQAAVAKFGVNEWADGTAMYYWFHNSQFGAPGWLEPVVYPLVTNAYVVTGLTWGTILLELTLALGLVVNKRAWRHLLAGGVVLHLGIAFALGLPSFALAMFGALLLFLRPVEQPFRLRLPVPVRVRRPVPLAPVPEMLTAAPDVPTAA